jgi:opacity protein-like surface antigen
MLRRSLGIFAALPALAVAALPFAAPARAEFYISGSGGYFDINKLHATRSGFSADADFDNRFLLNGALGYRFQLPAVNLRLEVEGGYGQAKVSSVSVTTPTGSSQTGIVGGDHKDLYTATLNGFVDFPVTALLSPYIGAGVGASYTDLPTVTTASGDVTFRGGSQATLLIVGEAGVSINVLDRLSLVPAYRYLHFNSQVSGVDDLDAHVFKLGLRITF